MASSYLVGAPDEASCMRYEIYVIRESEDAREREDTEAMAVDGDGGIDDDASSTLLAAARSHVAAAVASSPARVRDHLWYRDSLLSSLRASADEEPPWRRKETKKKKHASADASTSTSPPSPPPLPPCLWGELDFGDAVDDEWAAAWMLLKATAEGFKADGGGKTTTYRLAARCWDDDGDFLLIEAAEALPRWLSPLTSENRCWLFGGRVHLIPRRWRWGSGGGGAAAEEAKNNRVGEQQEQQQPTLAEALEVLSRGGGLCPSSSSSSSSPSSSDAGPKVHAALARRLGDPQNPPRALLRPLHLARALVPPRLAALLLLSSSSQGPGLVSAAVDAFYRRDPRGLRAASRARWFPPCGGAAAPSNAAGEGAPRSSPLLVPALVRTTRLQFAQLALQQYAPPTKGRAGWPCLPLGHRDAAAVELGAKLAAGFEILMELTSAEEEGDGGGAEKNEGDGPSSSSSAAPPPLPSDPLSLDALDPPGWKDYLRALEARGAFDGEMKGSARHQELRRQAAAAFSSMKRAGAGGDSSAPPPPPPSSAASAAALRVAAILKSLGEDVDAEALRAAGEAAVAAAGGESSVAWLRGAAPSSSSPSASASASASAPAGGESDDDDEFLAAIAAAEAGQAAEAERKLRRRGTTTKKNEGGGSKDDGAGDDDNDYDVEGGCGEGKKDGAAADFDPASVVDRVKSFVEKMSSWEGAETQTQASNAAAAAAVAAAAAAAAANNNDDDEARFAGDRVGGGTVTLDEASFWDELGAALGVPLSGSGAGGLEEVLSAAAAGEGGEGEEEEDSDDEGSSFYSGAGDSDDDSDSDGGEGEEKDPSRPLPRKLLEAEAARLRALEASGSRARRGAPPPEEEESVGAAAAGGSRFAFPASAAAAAAAEKQQQQKKKKKEEEEDDDDDDDFAFATAYEAELGRQLRGTTLGQTWGGEGGGGGGGGGGEQGEEDGDDEDDDDDTEAGRGGLPRKRAATSDSAVGGSSGIACLDNDSNNNPLAPVDVDTNLLESLLASYAGEAGLPGPASTLAGMLGVSLPTPAAAVTAAASASPPPSALAPPTPSTSEKE